MLGSDAPAPGGGSAAALAGALGAALTAMVGSLTVGRKKYAEFDGLARETLEKARDLEHRFLDVMERDTEAFNEGSAVFAMPKDTDEEKAARKAAMQEALQGCTKTPFEMMELSLEALRLTDGLVDRSNASAASDLGCAALHLGSAVQGAWLNVLINLGSIRDAAFAAQYRTRGQILLDEAGRVAYTSFLEVLLEGDGGAYLWHCTEGKDRAGLGAVIVERALGVPEAYVRADYLATNLFVRNRAEGIVDAISKKLGLMKGLDADIDSLFYAYNDYYDRAMAAVSANYGSFDAYLTEALDFGPEKRQALRAKYLR